jgi:hypothetical protein
MDSTFNKTCVVYEFYDRFFISSWRFRNHNLQKTHLEIVSLYRFTESHFVLVQTAVLQSRGQDIYIAFSVCLILA